MQPSKGKCATILIAVILTTTAFCAKSFAINLSISSQPYLTGTLFTRPLLPQEGEEFTITIRAKIEGKKSAELKQADARLIIKKDDTIILDRVVPLAKRGEKDGYLEGTITDKISKNGIYTIVAIVDPENKISEDNEEDNRAELIFPIIVAGRKLFFIWNREVPTHRWMTVALSTSKENRQRLYERGVIPLYYESVRVPIDKELIEKDPQAALEKIEEELYKRYTKEGEDIIGFGIDETGGYPGTFREQISIAAMKALARAKEKLPERIFAVWHGGGVRKELAQYFRKSADFLLLETYLWRAIPERLSAENVYEAIRVRIDPLIRPTDMIVPAYGNPCYTFLGLDTSERPDFIDLGEQEQAIRFIRRFCPEMRGIAFYNGGYGNYCPRTEELDRHHQKVLANADRLCFEYFVKPCLTFIEESLWLTKTDEDKYQLVAALSNIGGVDSGPVTVEFYVDGKSIGQKKVNSVPAGPNRTVNRAFLRMPLENLKPGYHKFKAKIIDADGTVLDPKIELERFIK